ncbi:MAG: sulfurtransferase TusA family protein [Aquificaceae bacterium]
MQVLEEVKVIDLSGLVCPLPIVMTSEHVKRLEEGQIVQVMATDPGFEKDIMSWCQQTGNELVSISREGEKTIAVIKKTSSSKEPPLIYWIKFHSLGVKLHIREFLMRINPFVKKPDHFITFVAISEGTKAEKFLKGRAKLIPIPDEIDPRCGVVLALKGYQKAKEVYDELSKEGFGVEAIYRREGESYKKVYPDELS